MQSRKINLWVKHEVVEEAALSLCYIFCVLNRYYCNWVVVNGVWLGLNGYNALIRSSVESNFLGVKQGRTY